MIQRTRELDIAAARILAWSDDLEALRPHLDSGVEPELFKASWDAAMRGLVSATRDYERILRAVEAAISDAPAADEEE